MLNIPETGSGNSGEKPDDRTEEKFDIDTTQFTGVGGEKTKFWSAFAMKHLRDMRILRDAGLLGKENQDWRNIAEHSLVVGALAGFLAGELRKQGLDIDPEMVESAAILHDATKRLDIEKGIRYSTEREQGELKYLLTKSGYTDEFIKISSYTGRVPEIYLEGEEQDREIDNITTEQLIVAYSDAKIRNVNVVSLEDARDANKTKDSHDENFYDEWYFFYKKVESRILEKMGDIKPKDIDNERVSRAISERRDIEI